MNVLAAYEPGSPPALELLLDNPRWQSVIRGRVLDLGCGTGWATARLSKVPAVDEVIGVDMSPGFLDRVTRRILGTLNARAEKVRLVASVFSRIPCADHSCDAAFLIAAIHHSLSPLVLLREVHRCLSPDGHLLIFEAPSPWFGVKARRRSSIEITRTSGATEFAYSKSELRYVLEWSGFDIEDVLDVPSAAESPVLWKRWIRRALRWSRLDRLVTCRTLYFIARPRPDQVEVQPT